MSFNLAFNCIYGIFSLNKSWLRDWNALFLLEFDLADEGDPSNIQVNIYTLQEREPMVQ
jgi:hypothetical protein